MQFWGKSLKFSRGTMVAAALFWSVLLILLLHWYFSFYPSYASFDQGIFNQLFWNGTHGRFFQSSLSSTLSSAVTQSGELADVSYHRLGQHFTPALLLWLPIYALFPASITLLILQITIVTAAGLVLYILACQYLNPKLSTLITISFYAANAVIGPTLANFHDSCQLPLYMFGLLLALEKRSWWWFGGLALLVPMVREDAGVVLFSLGVYLVLSRRYPRIGLAVCTYSMSYMLLVTNVVMPWFSEDISRRFMIEQFGSYIDGNEASTLDVIWALISQPQKLLAEIFNPLDRKINYLLGHWLPLAFVPAISPSAWSIAGFPLLQILIRDDGSAININLRYAMTLLPGLFYGTILWWSHRPQALKLLVKQFWIACISLSLFFTFTSNPNRTWSFIIPDSFNPWVYVSLPSQWRHVGHIRSFLDQIPDDASASATKHIIPHLSSRRELVRFPSVKLRNDAGEAINVEYVVLDLKQLQQYQVAFDREREKLQAFVPEIERILIEGEYGLVGLQDGIVFMQLGETSDPAALQRWAEYRQEIDPILHS
ncbi:MAG: DUF2079 domain-containing protein [Cyanothece sp. SIO1E1]|nr:DUF2079 domain-containing protein [Cyanothece sp. SIO1E1]